MLESKKDADSRQKQPSKNEVNHEGFSSVFFMRFIGNEYSWIPNLLKQKKDKLEKNYNALPQLLPILVISFLLLN